MNLTYLCYGSTNIYALCVLRKGISLKANYIVEILQVNSCYMALDKTRGFTEIYKNKKVKHSFTFSPNLTTNLTYLCYGSTNIYTLSVLGKGICLMVNIWVEKHTSKNLIREMFGKMQL